MAASIIQRWRRKWQPTPLFLPGQARRIPRTEEPSGLQSKGLQESDTTAPFLVRLVNTSVMGKAHRVEFRQSDGAFMTPGAGLRPHHLQLQGLW